MRLGNHAIWEISLIGLVVRGAKSCLDMSAIKVEQQLMQIIQLLSLVLNAEMVSLVVMKLVT